MQFLSIDRNTTLSELSQAVGSRNVDTVLTTNGLTRSPNIGQQFYDKCQAIEHTGGNVSTNRKMTLLNTLTSDSEAFEKACLMSDAEWKVFSATNTFEGALKIPSSISVPSSSSIIGNNQSVSSTVYQKTMSQLKNTGSIDSSIFSDYASGANGAPSSTFGTVNSPTDIFSAFAIPWGEVQLYSSISQETIDFPCYPEELETSRVANYTTMEDTLYQYEPWYAYETSGPREQNIVFKFHRDMWTGDHRDGKANELIRFCEANCYPQYDGASVNTPIVTLYVHGSTFVSGIMTNVTTHWSGPIGLDGWYLECELTLSITEIAQKPLSYDSIKTMDVVGGFK